MIAATPSGQPADEDGLENRARQLGTEHGQEAGERFVIPDTTTAENMLRVLNSGNLQIEYSVSQGVHTSVQRMCEGLGITVQDPRMPTLWTVYGASYNDAGNTLLRRRAETVVAQNPPVESQRWDVQITVRGGQDIRRLVAAAMAELTALLLNYGIHAEATAFKPDGDAYDSWSSCPDDPTDS